MRRRSLVALGVVAGLAAVLRRISKRTGVTADEVAAPRPGDDIVAAPTSVWNRGTTIAAAPAEIWPWLAQMGYGRAGFYAPEWVDRIAWRVPTANRYELLPEFAHIDVGDVLADGPNYLAYWRVKIAEPEQALVLWTRRHPGRGVPVNPADESALQRREQELLKGGTYLECSWGFFLVETRSGHTRLLIRTRGLSSPRWVRSLPYGVVDAWLSHAQLTTIKHLVERDQTYPRLSSLDPRHRSSRS